MCEAQEILEYAYNDNRREDVDPLLIGYRFGSVTVRFGSVTVRFGSILFELRNFRFGFGSVCKYFGSVRF